ncbi:MAG: hypothetical protein DDT19_02719 [Syntrophomonadaceae bacterium]|nr:hypothetical protein [Bacillota bacterium]
MGAESWGVFSYVISLAAFFTVFSDIGLNAVLTREVSKNPNLRQQYFSTTFFIKLILLAISVLVVIFIAPFFTKIEAAKILLPIVTLIIIFDGLREFGMALNRALEKMEREAVIKIFTNLSIAVLGIIFLIFSSTAKSLAFSYAIGSALGFLLTIRVLWPYFKNLLTYFSKNLLRPIFSAAWPFALLGLSGTIMVNTDILMLNLWRSAEEIGFYSANQRIIQFFYIIPMLLSVAIFPSLARLANTDNEKFRRLLEKSISASLFVGIPIVFGGLILSEEIINLLFGAQYLPAVPAFKLLLITVLIIFPSYFIGNAVFAHNQQKKFIIFSGLGAFSNVALNYFLIPPFGIIGAAIATLGALILSNIFLWLKMKKINYFTVLPHLKKILLATALMTLLTFTLKNFDVNFFINLFASALLYFGLLIIWKEKILKEIKTILRCRES